MKWKKILETMSGISLTIKVIRFLIGLATAIATLQWSTILDFLKGTPNG